MNEAMKNMKLIPSKRQAPNLKRILTRAKFGSTSKDKTKVTQCKDPRYHTCKEILVGNQIELGSKSNKTTFNIKTNMDCGVRDFIYVIICRILKDIEENLRAGMSANKISSFTKKLLKKLCNWQDE